MKDGICTNLGHRGELPRQYDYLYRFKLELVAWVVLQLRERIEQWAENRASYHARPPQRPRIHLPRTKVRYS